MEVPVNIHFAGFLEDPEEYMAVMNFWAKTLQILLFEDKLDWQPFYNNPSQDGNPVFSAWLPLHGKLLCIIQFIPGTRRYSFLCLGRYMGGWPAGTSNRSGNDRYHNTTR